jgi:hypothetical protein
VHQGNLKELVIPPAVMSDPRAVELARVWVAGGSQHVSIATSAWEDPAAWGLMLADLARHIARAYHEVEGRDPSAVLACIRSGFDAEWHHPTDDPVGGVT